MWFDPRPQLTYNRIFNFVVGVRGGGKTFNTNLYAMDKALEKERARNWEFIYLRRQQVDLDDSCMGGKSSRSIFSDIQHKGYHGDKDIKVAKTKAGGYAFVHDDHTFGHGLALSTASSRRSVAYPNVQLIIFDEFLIDTKTSAHQKYLNKGNEWFTFLNFYETVARGRDIPVMFLGNAFSMVNPYFLGLGIRIPGDIRDNNIYKGSGWTFQSVRDPEFIAARANTQLYQVTQGSAFHDHAYSNKYYLDSAEFLRKRDPETEHYFSIAYLGKLYGVWVDWDRGIFYVSSKGGATSKHKTLSLSLADNSPNNVNIRRYRNYPFMKFFRSAVESNSVYYDTQEAYNHIHEVIYLTKSII